MYFLDWAEKSGENVVAIAASLDQIPRTIAAQSTPVLAPVSLAGRDELMKIRSYPVTYFLDRNGAMKAVHVGPYVPGSDSGVPEGNSECVLDEGLKLITGTTGASRTNDSAPQGTPSGLPEATTAAPETADVDVQGIAATEQAGGEIGPAPLLADLPPSLRPILTSDGHWEYDHAAIDPSDARFCPACDYAAALTDDLLATGRGRELQLVGMQSVVAPDPFCYVDMNADVDPYRVQLNDTSPPDLVSVPATCGVKGHHYELYGQENVDAALSTVTRWLELRRAEVKTVPRPRVTEMLTFDPYTYSSEKCDSSSTTDRVNLIFVGPGAASGNIENIMRSWFGYDSMEGTDARDALVEFGNWGKSQYLEVQGSCRAHGIDLVSSPVHHVFSIRDHVRLWDCPFTVAGALGYCSMANIHREDVSLGDCVIKRSLELQAPQMPHRVLSFDEPRDAVAQAIGWASGNRLFRARYGSSLHLFKCDNQVYVDPYVYVVYVGEFYHSQFDARR